jgi:RimJ/RimL family protein N-acetyltransferase
MEQRTPAPSGAQGSPLRLVSVPAEAMRLLAAGDRDAASAELGLDVGEYVAGERWLWQLRSEQLAREPGDAPWVARIAVAESEGVVVGHCGFHAAPDADGRVEIAYSVAPEARRRGYGRAMLQVLLERAAAEPGVETVRATISPDNAASLATLAGHGFTRVGEQWDDEDGLELIYERPAR